MVKECEHSAQDEQEPSGVMKALSKGEPSSFLNHSLTGLDQRTSRIIPDRERLGNMLRREDQRRSEANGAISRTAHLKPLLAQRVQETLS
jgi:hypothetical protein